MIIECYEENLKGNWKRDIVTAFYNAYFQRVKELSGKDLQKVLDSIDNPSKEMTDEEMFEFVKRYSDSFKG